MSGTMVNPIEEMVKQAVTDAIREVVREELQKELKDVHKFIAQIESLFAGLAASKGMFANAYRAAVNNANDAGS